MAQSLGMSTSEVSVATQHWPSSSPEPLPSTFHLTQQCTNQGERGTGSEPHRNTTSREAQGRKEQTSGGGGVEGSGVCKLGLLRTEGS